jgi:DNA primase
MEVVNNMDNLQEVLNKIGYTNLKDLGNEYQTLPLYRHSDNNTALVIRKSDGVWFDFVTKEGGSLSSLVQKTLRLTTYEAAGEFLKEGGYEVVEKKDSKYASLITAQKTFDKSMLTRLLPKHEYWADRGISLETVKTFEGGLTFNGRMAGRYVFPIFNSRNEVVGFAGRMIKENPLFPKWKLISQKSQWVYPLKYNRAEIIQKKSVILVESIGDMLSLWECGVKNVLVTFGLDVGEKIIEFLLKLDVGKVYIGLNDDSQKNSAGNKASKDMVRDLSKYFDENQIQIITPKYNDFNEWLINNREELTEFLHEHV